MVVADALAEAFTELAALTEVDGLADEITELLTLGEAEVVTEALAELLADFVEMEVFSVLAAADVFAGLKVVEALAELLTGFADVPVFSVLATADVFTELETTRALATTLVGVAVTEALVALVAELVVRTESSGASVESRLVCAMIDNSSLPTTIIGGSCTRPAMFLSLIHI